MKRLSRHLSAKISDDELATLNGFANRHGLSINAAIRSMIQKIESPESEAASLTKLAEQVSEMNRQIRGEMIDLLSDIARTLNGKISRIEGDTLWCATAISKFLQAQQNGPELLKIIQAATQMERDRRVAEQQKKKGGY